MALLLTGVEWTEGADPHALAEAFLRARVTSAEVVRRSLDARQKRKRWLANLKVEVEREERFLRRQGVRLWNERDEVRRSGAVSRRQGTWPDGVRPIVVGAGPAGLFAALRLAEAGAKVTLLERGEPVEQRVPKVNANWRGAPLDLDSNVVFGEGGAGTFSDGKIYTRRRDGELGWIFRQLVELGADRSILDDAYAHLGTDRVRAILPAFRERLQKMGVEIRFSAVVQDFLVEGGACVGVRLRGGEELRGAPVLVATGHSARDTYEAMLRAGCAAEARPISVGARIEHPQTVVDRGMYKAERGDLPPASYRLSHTPTGGRAAHTFCMCPGGIVVPASAQEERVVVNGMSFSARRAYWANSAIIVEVRLEDYPGTDPLAGVRFQDAIEARAFAATGGSWKAPAQKVVDLAAKKCSTDLPRSSYPHGIEAVDLRDVLGPMICQGMLEAIMAFDKKIPGFAGPEALLIAPETRTTAPVRFFRDAALQSSVPGLLPVGEGAGYAGGIISAALDGFRAAEATIVSVAPREST